VRLFLDYCSRQKVLERQQAKPVAGTPSLEYYQGADPLRNSTPILKTKGMKAFDVQCRSPSSTLTLSVPSRILTAMALADDLVRSYNKECVCLSSSQLIGARSSWRAGGCFWGCRESGVPLTAAPRFLAMCHGTHYYRMFFSAGDLLGGGTVSRQQVYTIKRVRLFLSMKSSSDPWCWSTHELLPVKTTSPIKQLLYIALITPIPYTLLLIFNSKVTLEFTASYWSAATVCVPFYCF
jgi:hypothetical protein